MADILLIEDNVTIRTALSRGLRELGHAVSSSPTALDGLRLAVQDHPDLIVLDLGLPDLDGGELLRMLRAVSKVPVIVATARDGDAERCRCWTRAPTTTWSSPTAPPSWMRGSGPCCDGRARARRSRSGWAGCAWTRARMAELDGVELELTPREFDVLHYLAARPGEVITKRELLTEVWQLPYGGADKTVDVHLSWLRRKLGETAAEPRYLHTVRGVGVKLVGPA